MLLVLACLFGLHDVDAHLAEHGEDVLDLLGIHLLRWQHRVDLVMRDVSALLRRTNELLDGRIAQIEQGQRRVRRLRQFLFRRLVFFFFFSRWLRLARHACLLRAHRSVGHNNHPYPMRRTRYGRSRWSTMETIDSASRECHRGVLKPGLTLEWEMRKDLPNSVRIGPVSSRLSLVCPFGGSLRTSASERPGGAP